MLARGVAADSCRATFVMRRRMRARRSHHPSHAGMLSLRHRARQQRRREQRLKEREDPQGQEDAADEEHGQEATRTVGEAPVRPPRIPHRGSSRPGSTAPRQGNAITRNAPCHREAAAGAPPRVAAGVRFAEFPIDSLGILLYTPRRSLRFILNSS